MLPDDDFNFGNFRVRFADGPGLDLSTERKAGTLLVRVHAMNEPWRPVVGYLTIPAAARKAAEYANAALAFAALTA